MFKKIDWVSTFKWASFGALLFCVPAFIYIIHADYTLSWILFLGSVLFLFVNAFHNVVESKKRGGDESTIALVFAAHVTTIAGILLACLVCFILLVILVPGYLEAAPAEKLLTKEPASMVMDKTNGLSFNLFISATVLNFAGGSIAGITVPFYAKRNQTKDNKEPVPLQQNDPAKIKSK